MSVVDDVGGVGGVGDVGDGTGDGIGDSGVVDRGVLLAVLTQSTSLFIVSYNPLCVIRQLEISGSTFVRAPVCHDVILNSSNITALQVFAGRKMTNSDYHRCASTLFVLDTNGRLLAIEILSSTRSQTVCRSSEKALKSSDIGGRVESTDETQKMNNGDEEWKTDLEIEMYEVLRVDVETFAPLTIVEEEAKEEKDCERGCDNLSESVLCKHHTRRYCAVFGARDDRLRCFRISRLNDI
ncbi:hypothetical protein AB6A40_006866 [Gnathostoma spinigerum]|uniref:Uncharacterized protein n=1 Tax=Gnathostoma spinigerum TaxID=75299 RepID=A0ABD6ELT1_9BILA